MREQITKNDFAEFYVLSALSPIIESNATHKHLIVYRNKLISDIVDFYLKHLQEACVQEAMHTTNRFWPKKKKEKKEELHRIGIYNSADVNEEFLFARGVGKGDPRKSAERLIRVFRYMDWEQSYGGEAWARIADLYKELVECRTLINRLNDDGFDPELGYDVYTYSTLRSIREHIGGNQNKFAKIMNVIDMIHQVEHNTGSIFTKFPGNMTIWLDKLLNAKAIAGSIQLLRENVGVEVRQAIKELNVEDIPSAILEEQLGEVIISRRIVKRKKNMEEDLRESGSTEKWFQRRVDDKKNKERVNQDKLDPDFYADVLSEYRFDKRMIRSILRAIVKLSETEPELSSNDRILLYSREQLYTDYEVFKLFESAPAWHELYISKVAPFYLSVPFKWRHEVANFFFKKFPELKITKLISPAIINMIYEHIEGEGYDTSTLVHPDPTSDKVIVQCTCYDCLPQINNHINTATHKNNQAKAFAETNAGKLVVGLSKWVRGVNTNSDTYLDANEAIGTVIGWKKTGKICFAPSDYWKKNDYSGIRGAVEYTLPEAAEVKPKFYDVALPNIEIYDPSKPKKFSKPKTTMAFAHVFAGKSIKLKNTMKDWNVDSSIGRVVGYCKENNLIIYFAPSEKFKPHYTNFVDQTLVSFTTEPVDCCLIYLEDVELYTDVKISEVDFHYVPKKPEPPKGTGSVKEFAAKYAGKEIKATEKYFHKLNAVNHWNGGSIGTIIGFSSTKLYFTPNTTFIEAGWKGIDSCLKSAMTITAPHINAETFYTINLLDVKLTDPAEYEKQNEPIAENGFTENQNFAITNAGKEIYGETSAWKVLSSYVNDKKELWNVELPIGTIAGYKGSLVCYTPSPKMIELGFDGEVIDGMVYTDDATVNKKCYTVINANTITLNKPLPKKPITNNDALPNGAPKTIDNSTPGKTFAELFAGKEVYKTKNLNGWDPTKPVGIVVGYKLGGMNGVVWKCTPDYEKHNPGFKFISKFGITYSPEGCSTKDKLHWCAPTSLKVSDEDLDTDEQKLKHFVITNAGKSIKLKNDDASQASKWGKVRVDLVDGIIGTIAGYKDGNSYYVYFIPAKELQEAGYGSNFGIIPTADIMSGANVCAVSMKYVELVEDEGIRKLPKPWEAYKAAFAAIDVKPPMRLPKLSNVIYATKNIRRQKSIDTISNG